MDVFFEQIIPIRKTGKTIAVFFGIWILAALLAAVVFYLLGSFSLIFIFGIGYGAYILSSKLNVEYEYIITNGILDIDKITNKSSRKRIISLDLSGVTRLEKFNTNATLSGKDTVFACDRDDPNAYLVTAQKAGEPAVNFVFSPNDKIKSAIMKFAPKFITNSVFKD